MLKNSFSINYEGELLELCPANPIIMGILNITPDSFYAHSRLNDEKSIVKRAEQILEKGGTIIDIGAYSSRPGAAYVPVEEELSRLSLALKLIKKEFPTAKLSIDTFRSQVVATLFNQFGSFIVNDISAGEMDSEMFATVGKLKLPYIAMHMKGTPQNMQDNPFYENIIDEIINYFIEKIYSLREHGVNDIIIDPGFGFAKTVEHNYELLHKLDELKVLELPVLVGLSRKSMFYNPLKLTPQNVLPATIAANTIAVQKNAHILRVHDVNAAKQLISVYKMMNNITL